MSNLYLTVTGRAFEADGTAGLPPRTGGLLSAVSGRLFGKVPAAAPRAEGGCSLVDPLALPPDWLGAPDVIGLFLDRSDAQAPGPGRDER